MDGRRFDHITQVFAGASSRRKVLRGVIGGLGAAVLGRSTIGAQQNPMCQTDADCAYITNGICGDNIFGACGCPSGFAPCSPTLCCPVVSVGGPSTCPPAGGTACVSAKKPKKLKKPQKQKP